MAAYEDMVRLIRVSAEDDDGWPEMLVRLADYLGVIEATLGGGMAGELPTMIAPRTDPAEIDRYLSSFHADNRLMRQMVSQSPGRIAFDYDMPDYKSFQKDDFYNDWCLPQNYRHAIGVSFATTAGWHGALMLNFAEEIDTRQVETFQAALPELTRAIEANTLLRQFRTIARSSLDILGMSGQSALMLDRNGQVLDGNSSAEALLREGRFVIRGGRLALAEPAADRKFSRLLAQCLARPDSVIEPRLQLETPDGPLIVQCAPYPGGALFPSGRRPAALVIVTDPLGRLRQRLLRVQRDFGLTAAEAELAIALVQTGSRKAAADRRGVSDATARAQLTSIFDKTGIRQQTELVRLLMEGD